MKVKLKRSEEVDKMFEALARRDEEAYTTLENSFEAIFEALCQSLDEADQEFVIKRLPKVGVVTISFQNDTQH